MSGYFSRWYEWIKPSQTMTMVWEREKGNRELGYIWETWGKTHGILVVLASGGEVRLEGCWRASYDSNKPNLRSWGVCQKYGDKKEEQTWRDKQSQLKYWTGVSSYSCQELSFLPTLGSQVDKIASTIRLGACILTVWLCLWARGSSECQVPSELRSHFCTP